MSVLVTSVVPWTTSQMGRLPFPLFDENCFSRSAITVVTASPGSRGVVSVFATQICPPGVVAAKPSVNVPPISTAIRTRSRMGFLTAFFILHSAFFVSSFYSNFMPCSRITLPHFAVSAF